MKNFFSTSGIIFSASAIGMLLLISATNTGDPVIETGPYPLSYPENFGNKIYLPDDKPVSYTHLGMNLFMNTPNPEKNIRGANCGRCHGTPKTFIELYHNNGLDTLPADIGREKLTGNPLDKGRFRVPTLRNIALTAPYMHDGRFKTLEEVIDHYNEHIAVSAYLSPLLQNVSNTANGKNLDLTANEKKDIISFLNLLTDTDFINDKKFSDPHKN